MHYNSFKTRFLRVMLLSLVFLLTAGQLNAKVIYFKNNSNWGEPRAHMWVDGGESTNWPGVKMVNINNGWYCIETGNYNKIIFSDNGANKTDETSIPSDKIAYDNGWTNNNPKLYLKHPWDGGNWDWVELTPNMSDGTYSVQAKYGNDGFNWNSANNDTGKKWIEGTNVVKVNNPEKYNLCYINLNPAYGQDGQITVTKLGAEAINEIYIFGSLDIDAWGDDYGVGKKMTDAGNGVFTYDFTMKADGGKYFAFHSKTNYGNYKFLRNGANTEIAMGGTAAYAMHTDRNDVSYYVENLQANAKYRITVNTSDNTIGIVLLEEPAYVPVYNTVYIFGGIADGKYDQDHCSILLNDNKGIFPYTFKYQQGMGNGWAYRVRKADGSWKTICKSAEATLDNEIDLQENDNFSNNAYYSNSMQPGHVYTVYLNTNTNKVYLREGGKNGIPVYPRGVQSEAELDAYDFSAQPAVYLLSNVLNNNRVTPEWQMINDGTGRFHLNGFAARTADDYKVRVYTSKDTYVESASVALNFGDVNLSEGKLYNASVTMSDGKYVLQLTEDASAQGRMPFISLVGYAMQQNQDYKTPRAFEGHPADVSTSKGWQEAWLLYDENGNLVKDRQGNVMYTTMWPPKNPVYFTANVGGERLYTSENMTFKPVTGEDGNYVGKTGAEWEAELKNGEEAEAYNGLNLDANTVYYRYVVPEIWYVGSAKIWTGWNGEAINNSGWKAMWSYHRNWGYSNRKSTDTDGTDIDAETTYGVSTAEGSNGNFKFDNPTYFKTIEFFYSTEHPNTGSKIYTTLAFGNAQIEAQSHKNNGKYDYGQYRPTVNPESGVTVLNYTIRCYDAATGKLVTLNNGIVAQGNGNPTATTFQDAQSGLAEGKYYFEMEVVFQTANGTRTATVKSNPFIIYFPGVYTVEPVALQVVGVKNNDNTYTYVTYNKNTENAPLFTMSINDDNELTAVAPVAEGERAALFTKFESNTGIDWTDKVLVVAPVPAQFKLDAEKADAKVSIDNIVNYTLNSAPVAKAVDGSMAYLDNSGMFTDKVYTAAMNYKETVEGVVSDKTSAAKPASTLMMRPNPVAGGEATVTVEKVANTSAIIVDEVPVAADYYKVCVELPFADANVTATADQPAYQVTVDGVSKLYTATTGDKAITIAAVNPTQASDVKVSTLYKDAQGNYTLAANIGDELSLTADNATFTKVERSIRLFKMASVKVKGEELYDNYITNLGIEQNQNQKDKLADLDLDPQYYKFELTINNEKVLFNQYFNKVFYNVENVNNFDVNDALKVSRTTTDLSKPGSSASICIAPVYPVLVNATVGAKGMTPATTAAGAPALKADPTYVALYGKPAEAELASGDGGGIVTGIDGVDTSKAVQSVRFVNVAGQMSDKPFEGMNIMVTTYTDGTTATAKVIK